VPPPVPGRRPWWPTAAHRPPARGGRAWRADRPSQRPSALPSEYRVRAQFSEQIFVTCHNPRAHARRQPS
jgi:hypothetical protein